MSLYACPSSSSSSSSHSIQIFDLFFEKKNFRICLVNCDLRNFGLGVTSEPRLMSGFSDYDLIGEREREGDDHLFQTSKHGVLLYALGWIRWGCLLIDRYREVPGKSFPNCRTNIPKQTHLGAKKKTPLETRRSCEIWKYVT